MYSVIYKNIKTGFEKSGFKFYFQYTAIARQLNQERAPNLSEFVNTYRASWWWNRWYFSSCIQDPILQGQFDNLTSHKHPQLLIGMFSNLDDANILTTENMSKLANHPNPENLALVIQALKDNNILSSNTIDLVTQDNDLGDIAKILSTHKHPQHLMGMFSNLHDTNILTIENMYKLANHPNPENLALVIQALKDNNILSSNTIDLVTKIKKAINDQNDSPEIELAIYSLKLANLWDLEQDNIKVILAHPTPHHFAWAFCDDELRGFIKMLIPKFPSCPHSWSMLIVNWTTGGKFNFFNFPKNANNINLALYILKSADILTQENISRVTKSEHPLELASMLSYLNDAGILTEENISKVSAHHWPFFLAWALYDLNKANILNQSIFDAFINHKEPWYFVWALCNLQDANLLVPNILDAVAKQKNLYCLVYCLRSLNQEKRLTQALADHFIYHSDLSELTNPLQILQKNNLFTSENIAAVAKHAKPLELARAFVDLMNARIYTDMRDTVANLCDPSHLMNGLITLRDNKIKYKVADASIILADAPTYQTARKILSQSFCASLLIPETFHDLRENALMNIAARLWERTTDRLPYEVLRYILQFTANDFCFRIEAKKVIQDVQFPESLDTDQYKRDLEKKTQEHKASLYPSHLFNTNLWNNGDSSADIDLKNPLIL